MNNRCLCLSLFLCLFYGASLTAAEVFARFRVLEPAQGEVYLQMGGYIHKAPWYLPKGRFPEDKGTTFSAGKWSGWLNLTQWSQGRLHGRMNRSGGVAEFPNVTLDIQCSEDYSGRAIEVELAISVNITVAVPSEPSKVKFSLADSISRLKAVCSIPINSKVDLGLETCV